MAKRQREIPGVERQKISQLDSAAEAGEERKEKSMSRCIDKKFPLIIHVTRDQERNDPESYLVAHENGFAGLSADEYDGAEVTIYWRDSVRKFMVTRTLSTKAVKK